jgi:TonB family protein
MMSLIIETTLRSILLGIGVALALTMLRVRSPHLQKSAWTAVLVAAFLMPVLMRTHGPAIHAPSYVLTLTSGGVGPAASSPMRPGLAAIYCAVMLLLATRYAFSLMRVILIRRKARRVVESWAANLDVRVATKLRGPATFGATILLPEEHVHWSRDKREAIIAHERAHVLAHDCQRLWLANLYKCLFWLNPFAWWLERRIAVLAEETSDAAALQILRDGPAYAEILLEFAAAGGMASTVVTGMGCPRIGARIDRIIGGKAMADEPRMWRRSVAVAGVAPAILLCSTLQLAHGSTVGAPSILDWPTAQQLIQFYPAEARRAGIDGAVTLAVTLDSAGHATDTTVAAEDPRNLGFGAAAAAVARVMKYRNPTGRTAQLEFRIKFALHHPRPSANPPR